MNNELNYLIALGDIVQSGEHRGDRTGTGTLSKFGLQLEFNLQDSFPLLTTKKIHFQSVAEELLWMLRGQTNVRTLNAHIWDEWATESGALGPIYGQQWRSWETPDGSIDQITQVIIDLNNNPNSRRHIVSAWNVGQLEDMALPPCHLLFQFYVSQSGKLDCQVYQRSADMFLGVPFNIASYALLTHIIAHFTNLKPGRLIWVGGDCHIYNNHMEAVATQLARNPVSKRPSLTLSIPDDINFDELIFNEHIHLKDYDPLPGIRAEVSV